MFEFQIQEDAQKDQKMYEADIAESRKIIRALSPLVINKLIGKHTEWQCYSDLDACGEPAVLAVSDSILYINDVETTKQLVLEEVVSQYNRDPFDFAPGGTPAGYGDRFLLSQLLTKVVSCNLKDLFLYSQALTWREYEKLVSSKTIQKFYFWGGQVTDENRRLVPLERMLELMPNIERFTR